MLTEDASRSVLFLDLSQIVESLGYSLVEASKSDTKSGVSLRVLCYKREGEINTDDLEILYNAIYPRYSLQYGRDLTLEVSSPGINRNIKDILEFKVFIGKRVKVYSTKYSSYVLGEIKDAQDASLTLSDYLIEDQKESGDELIIDYSDISKAKLDYITEAKEK